VFYVPLFTVCWFCLTILSQAILAQQSQNVYEKCYNLTTATHCFKTERTPLGSQLRKFNDAINWCNRDGYSLAKIESLEVQCAIEHFLEEFELTSDDVWIAANRTAQRIWTWVNGDVYADGRLISFANKRPK